MVVFAYNKGVWQFGRDRNDGLRIANDKAQSLLNVFVMLRVAQAYVPLLLQSETCGLFVNHASVALQTAGFVPSQGAYNASPRPRLPASPRACGSSSRGFGIRVVNLLISGTQSTFLDNAPAVAHGTEAAMRADAVAGGPQWREAAVWIWRGRHATEVRLASLLPVDTLDGVIERMSKLDVLEQRLMRRRD